MISRALAMWGLVLGLALSGCGSGSGTETPQNSETPSPDSPDDSPPPDDPPDRPTVTLTVDDVRVDESSETVSIIVRAEGDVPEEEVSVDYATTDGSALSGSDYAHTSGTLVFSELGEQTVTVQIIDDTEPEGEEHFFLELSNAVNADIRNGAGVVTIIDDDEAEVCGQPASQPCDDGTGGEPIGYNIIVVFTDDQRFDTLEHMPNVTTRLMPQGVDFHNAYVPTPLCCPARASFYSGGFLSQNTGVLENNPPNGGMVAFDDRNNIGRQLQEAGYRTQFIGKWFNDYIRHAPYVPPGWDSFVGRRAWGNEDWWNFTYVTATSRESSTVGDQVRAEGEYNVNFERDRIIEFIESAPPGSTSAKPYFVLWATTPPHLPSTPDDLDADAFAGFTYRGRGVGEEDLRDKPLWVQNYDSAPQRPRGDDEEIRNQLSTLLAIDRGLGAIIDVVEARGEVDETVFVVLSDNGYMWGEHGVWAKNKAYEESVRVPLLVVAPGIEARIDEHLVYAVLDIPATIHDLAGQSPRGDGRSLLPLLRDPNTAWRTELFFEKFGEVPSPDALWAGLRRDNWKYIEYVNGEAELYDLAADPFELENRVKDAAYADIRDSLKSRMEEQLALAIKPPFRKIVGRVGEVYSLILETWGSKPPLRWRVESGKLPPGLRLDAATGEIGGTPTTAGSWTVSIRVSDSAIAAQTGNPRTFVWPNLTIEIR